MKIKVIDRSTGKEFEEKVLGEDQIRWVYERRVGKWLGQRLLSRKFVSRAYGLYQSSALSARAIDAFVEDFKIPMEEFEAGPFKSFNDFFIRKFRPGARSFAPEPNRLCAFAEGRYLAFPSVTESTALPIKGALLDGRSLLQKDSWAQTFAGGPGFIARLCPVDYHRFHFPDDGEVLDEYGLSGPLHSVNPIALKANGRILFENERVVTVLQTRHFGKIAMIEVGALCVGMIHQSYSGKSFSRGQEKGYFLFGGSTVILLGEPGAFEIDEDLLRNTSQSVETYVKLGQPLATADASLSQR